MTLIRPARVLGAGVLGAGVLVAALCATLRSPGSSAAAPAPTSPAPGGSPSVPGGSPSAPGGSPSGPPGGGVCAPGDGIVVTATMVQDLATADRHGTLAPASGSFGSGTVGCDPNTESEYGWDTSGIPAPPQVNPRADDEDDPFDRENGLYLGYQFDERPDYWEQPIAFRASDAALIGSAWTGVSGISYAMTEVGWGDADTRRTVQGMLPEGPGCRWHGPVAATAMPGRVAGYTGGARPVYKYDHVPMRIGSRKFAQAPGGWFHYLCGAATPSGVTGPAVGTRMTGVQGDYYLTPHWVYAEGYTADQLTQVAPIVRAARATVNAQVITSPADRSVVNLKTWMWSDARRYDFVLGGRRAEVVPTGIRVVARGVPLQAHDLRAGGCGGGGTPDTGDPAGDTDCWFRFTKANSPDPADVYRVGFALRWQVRMAGVPPLTFWTTREQNFRVGEVQVPTR